MNDAIAKFWNDFQALKADLAQIESADDPVYDQLLVSLQKLDPDLYFMFCAEPDGNEFIVTAEGEQRLFALADRIVDQAPDISDWQLIALKPSMGFPVTTRWEQTIVTIGEVLVVPVFRETGEMGLQLYVADLTESNQNDIHNALLRALDVGLGERRFAESVTATWVNPISEAPEHAFNLPELVAYIDQREAG